MSSPLDEVQLRPAQTAAVEAAETVLGSRDACQVRMACGSGKTLAGIAIADRLRAKKVAVLVPSLDLIAQMIQVWTELLPTSVPVVAVCSDSTAAAAARIGGRTVVTTTDAHTVAHHLDAHDDLLVVGTYRSMDRLALGTRLSARELDLLISDEAHHLSRAKPTGALPAGLDRRALRASRRVFMTATPVVIDSPEWDTTPGTLTSPAAISMDDEKLFGPVAFTYSVRQAIRDGVLAPYRVCVAAEQSTPWRDEKLPLLALEAAAVRFDLHRAVAFHNRVEHAKQCTAAMNQWGGRTLLADTVVASVKASRRREALDRLSKPAGPGVTRVVNAARCLHEGVDVCAVDAVLFAAPRSSPLDIIQAVGRALRTHPGKDIGTIVIPVSVPAGDDHDSELLRSRFAPVWKVLRGLAAHDPDVTADLETISREHVVSAARASRSTPRWLEVIGAEAGARNTVNVVLAERDNSLWLRVVEKVEQLAAQRGGVQRIVTGDVVDGDDLGKFVAYQRREWRAGRLPSDRVTRLESIPGWFWELADVELARQVQAIADYADRYGQFADTDHLPSRLPAGTSQMPPLGRLAARLRRRYRCAELPVDAVEQLVQVPGWVWEPLCDRDRAGVEAFKQFTAWEGHTTVPEGHHEDAFPLRLWLDEVGFAVVAGTADPVLVDEIVDCAPPGPDGCPTMDWGYPRLRVEMAVAAARQFIARKGDLSQLPNRHEELLPCGASIRLYQWVVRLRHAHRRNQLDADLVATVESLPGWRWQARLPAVDDRVARHRACQRDAKARAVAVQQQNWITHPQAAKALTALWASADRRTVDVAAAVGTPQAMVRSILENNDERMPPQLARRILRTQQEDVLQWRRPGTRGRWTSAASDPGDTAQAHRHLQRLTAAGWSERQIAAAIGLRKLTLDSYHPQRPVFTRAAEHALTLLATDVCDSRLPDSA